MQKGIAPSILEINNGPCAYFAEITQSKFDGILTILNSNTFLDGLGLDEREADWIEAILKHYNSPLPLGLCMDDLNEMVFGYHQWVYSDGKHYDAECPEGVTNLFNLPFYQRQLEWNLTRMKAFS